MDFYDVTFYTMPSSVEQGVTFEVEAVGFGDAVLKAMEGLAKSPDKDMEVNTVIVKK